MMSNTYFAVRYMSSAQDRDYLVYARTYYNLNITLQYYNSYSRIIINYRCLLCADA